MCTTTSTTAREESRAVSRIGFLYRDLTGRESPTQLRDAAEAGADELLCLVATSARRRELLEQVEAHLVAEGWHPDYVAVFTNAVREQADL